MTARKAVAPKPDPMAWTGLSGTDKNVFALNDLDDLRAALDQAEAALQGFSAIKYAHISLEIDSKVVLCHHDGTKWWVKFG